MTLGIAVDNRHSAGHVEVALCRVHITAIPAKRPCSNVVPREEAFKSFYVTRVSSGPQVVRVSKPVPVIITDAPIFQQHPVYI